MPTFPDFAYNSITPASFIREIATPNISTLDLGDGTAQTVRRFESISVIESFTLSLERNDAYDFLRWAETVGARPFSYTSWGYGDKTQSAHFEVTPVLDRPQDRAARYFTINVAVRFISSLPVPGDYAAYWEGRAQAANAANIIAESSVTAGATNPAFLPSAVDGRAKFNDGRNTIELPLPREKTGILLAKFDLSTAANGALISVQTAQTSAISRVLGTVYKEGNNLRVYHAGTATSFGERVIVPDGQNNTVIGVLLENTRTSAYCLSPAGKAIVISSVPLAPQALIIGNNQPATVNSASPMDVSSIYMAANLASDDVYIRAALESDEEFYGLNRI